MSIRLAAICHIRNTAATAAMDIRADISRFLCAESFEKNEFSRLRVRSNVILLLCKRIDSVECVSRLFTADGCGSYTEEDVDHCLGVDRHFSADLANDVCLRDSLLGYRSLGGELVELIS